MILPLLNVVGIVIVLTENFYTVNLQDFPAPEITDTTITRKTNSSATLVGSQLSPNEIKTIHDEAKRISHSKGPIIDDQGEEPEYRRSLIRKLRLKTKSLALKKVVTKFENSKDESALPALETLEFLVHEYDTAIEFMNIGGMELLQELILIDDKRIASSALSVLSAAMQGNPVVQEIASKNRILDILLSNLVSKEYLPGVLYAVSSYLRNMPDSQMKFCVRGGIDLLVDVMKNHSNTLKFRMHAIEILGDISSELFELSYITYLSSKTLQLMKEFFHGIRATDACKEIALLLECNEYHSTPGNVHDKYYIHVKIIYAMNNLRAICTSVYQSSQVEKLIVKLINLYDPYANLPWYSSVDKQLRYVIYKDLMQLYKDVYQRKYERKIEL